MLERKVRLTEFFLDKTFVDESIVRNPSDFVPETGRDKEMDLILNNIKKHIPPPAPKKIFNTSREEIRAIQHLKDNKDIIIKEADKGGSVIVMNRKFYEEEINNHLNDTNTYKRIEGRPPNVHKRIDQLLKKYDGLLTDKELEYINEFASKSSNIYGLPKVHKSKLISDAIKTEKREVIYLPNPSDLQFRPIIAGPINPTSRLSNLIHILLKPLLPHIPSFIKDSQDFLKFLPQEIELTDIFVSFDIVSLYTNIPHKLGLSAIKFWLDKFPGLIPARIPPTFILESIELILTNNYFEFNNRTFLQIQGTAMGTKMAPTYANLTIGYLEWKLYQQLEHGLSSRDCKYIRQNWKRYLDDCFIIWKLDHLALTTFTNQLNNLHPAIKFTIETNTDSIPFLDIRISKRGTKIETDIYRKPTDTLNYIDFQSCHPRHTRTNIPYNMAQRIMKIVSNPQQQEFRLKELEDILLKKNYPKKLISDATRKAINNFRNPEGRKKNIPTNHIIPFITTHNPNNPNLFFRTKTLLQSGEQSVMKEINNRFRFINSKRQPPNLKKILTRAKFTSKPLEPGTSKCKDPRCGTCPLILTTTSITFNKFPNRPFIIHSKMDCGIKNVIYLIQCPKCNKEYIGQTNNLRKRVTIHKQQIQDPNLRKLSVSKHLHSCNPNPNLPFHICPLVPKEDETARKILENHLIRTYRPDLNETN